MRKGPDKRFKGEIWDPRQGKYFVTELENPKKSVFSSKDQNAIVLRLDVDTDISGKRCKPNPVYRTLLASGRYGFVNIYPSKHVDGKIDELGFALGQIGESRFGIIDISVQNVSRFLAFMSRYGSYEEWLIGSATAALNPIDAYLHIERTPSPQFDYFLSSFELIGAIWSFDLDGASTIILSRPSGQFDAMLMETGILP
jgi:hypothetical protein